MVTFDVVTGGFEQLPIANPAWARRFAGTASEAKVKVPNGSVPKRKASLLQGAH